MDRHAARRPPPARATASSIPIMKPLPEMKPLPDTPPLSTSAPCSWPGFASCSLPSSSFPSSSRPKQPFPAPSPVAPPAPLPLPREAPSRNETYRRRRRHAICANESDSDSASSVTCAPAPVSFTSPPPDPLGEASRSLPPKQSSATTARRASECNPRIASGRCRFKTGSVPTIHFPPAPPSINSSTSNSSLSATLNPPPPSSSSSSFTSNWSTTSSTPASSGSHPFLVDQRPYLPPAPVPRRESFTSLRSTASSSSALPSPNAPWTKGSSAACSVERFDRVDRDRIGSFGSSFGSAADHMLAVDDSGYPIARAVTPPALGARRTSHSQASQLSALRSAAAASTPSLPVVPTKAPTVPAHGTSFLPESGARSRRQTSPHGYASSGYALAAGPVRQTPRNSAASSISARSASSSSSSLHTPTPSSPETSPTTAIDRRCLTWMREAELHDYYFGSVQSRGALKLSAEERHFQREPLLLPPSRDVIEVLQEEKRSCNPLKRFASRT